MGYSFNTPQGTESGFQKPQGSTAEEAASPLMVEFTPTSGGIGQLVIINLGNMPAGFTLNDIKVGAVSLNSPTKNNDGQVQGNITPAHSTGTVEVTYNTTETVDSSALTPSVFTRA